MLSKSLQLEEKITQLQTLLQDLPSGKIYITHDGNHYKWYHSDSGKNTYIPKTNHSLAEQLAYKKYLSHLLTESVHEKKAIDLYLRHHKTELPKSETLFTNLPEYQQLLSRFFRPISHELQKWVTSAYLHNPGFPEHLNHKTCSGTIVRSKSEAMIDMVLYTNQIPFRYECALELEEAIIYPDFTIRHPETGKLFYWEHFGRMDYPEYCEKTISKLRLYTSHNIIPSINLITTYETRDNPLSIDIIENIVQHYFL